MANDESTIESLPAGADMRRHGTGEKPLVVIAERTLYPKGSFAPLEYVRRRAEESTIRLDTAVGRLNVPDVAGISEWAFIRPVIKGGMRFIFVLGSIFVLPATSVSANVFYGVRGGFEKLSNRLKTGSWGESKSLKKLEAINRDLDNMEASLIAHTMPNLMRNVVGAPSQREEERIRRGAPNWLGATVNRLASLKSLF